MLDLNKNIDMEYLTTGVVYHFKFSIPDIVRFVEPNYYFNFQDILTYLKYPNNNKNKIILKTVIIITIIPSI